MVRCPDHAWAYTKEVPCILTFGSFKLYAPLPEIQNILITLGAPRKVLNSQVGRIFFNMQRLSHYPRDVKTRIGQVANHRQVEEILKEILYSIGIAIDGADYKE